MSRPQQSRMRTPWRGRQQLDFLCHDKRPELRGKAFHEVLVGENSCPVLPPVGVVIKLPQMNELVDRAGVGLEVAHELVVMAALLERREAEFLVELRRFRHLADVECVRSHFVERHQGFSFINLVMQRSKPRPYSIASLARASSLSALLPIARRSLAYRMNTRSRGSPWACGIRSTRSV